jgi:predicted enzyme related to lactoylglutathione lyase
VTWEVGGVQERSDPGLPALAGVIIDVPAAGFAATVAFWAGALSASPERMSGMPGGDAYVELPGALAVSDVLLQRIDDADRPRFHLDVAVPDRAAAVRRAVDLGGRVVQQEDGWDVLADPASLPLCLGFVDPDPLSTGPRRSDRGYLDAILLDVPPDRVSAEVVFWSAVLDATPVPPDVGDPAYHPLGGVRAVGGAPVAVAVRTTLADPDRDGVAVPPRVHVDLSAADVDREVARLTALGARYVDAGRVERDRVTLVDPAGNLFCVVPTPG